MFYFNMHSSKFVITGLLKLCVSGNLLVKEVLLIETLKMATFQEKGKCVSWFIETKSNVLTQ